MPETWKATMIFRLSSQDVQQQDAVKRLGGWTESFHFQGEIDAMKLKLFGGATGGLCGARAALLPNQAVIVGQRYQHVDPVGRAQTNDKQFQGGLTLAQDIPGMAALVRLRGQGVDNTAGYKLAGIPDTLVQRGEADFDQNFSANLTFFIAKLGEWRFKGIDLTVPKRQLVSITADGLVTTMIAHGYAVGDLVRISRARIPHSTQGGKGLFTVTSTPTTTTFTINGWEFDNTTLGTARKQTTIYPKIDSADSGFERIVTRKIGRPFGQYVGRHSA